MTDLLDVYNELDCIADQLILLGYTVTEEFAESIGRPSDSVLQNAFYAVAQHIERVRDDVEKIDRRQN